jgi:hypothetical protein
MTSAGVVERLGRRVAGHRALPQLGEADEPLLRHMYVGAALLPSQVVRYRVLRERWEDDGTSAELRAEALEAAGDLAAVLQGARRERPRAIALRQTPLKSTQLFAALEQIFYSLVLLTAPEADLAGLSMREEELDGVIAMPSLQAWLDPESAVRQGFVLA